MKKKIIYKSKYFYLNLLKFIQLINAKCKKI